MAFPPSATQRSLARICHGSPPGLLLAVESIAAFVICVIIGIVAMSVCGVIVELLTIGYYAFASVVCFYLFFNGCTQ